MSISFGISIVFGLEWTLCLHPETSDSIVWNVYGWIIQRTFPFVKCTAFEWHPTSNLAIFSLQMFYLVRRRDCSPYGSQIACMTRENATSCFHPSTSCSKLEKFHLLSIDKKKKKTFKTFSTKVNHYKFRESFTIDKIEAIVINSFQLILERRNSIVITTKIYSSRICTSDLWARYLYYKENNRTLYVVKIVITFITLQSLEC